MKFAVALIMMLTAAPALAQPVIPSAPEKPQTMEQLKALVTEQQSKIVGLTAALNKAVEQRNDADRQMENLQNQQLNSILNPGGQSGAPSRP